jgi:hypothetical protein
MPGPAVAEIVKDNELRTHDGRIAERTGLQRAGGAG